MNTNQLNSKPVTLSSKKLEEQIDFGLENETLPDNFIELFGESPKLESLKLIDCFTNEDLDFRNFIQLKRVDIKIRFDAPNSGHGIKIYIPYIPEVEEMMYSTKDTIILSNTGSSPLCYDTLDQLTYIRLVNISLPVNFINSFRKLSKLQSLEIIKCKNSQASSYSDFDLRACTNLKKIEIIHHIDRFSIYLPAKLEEFHLTLTDNKSTGCVKADKCIALEKIILDVKDTIYFYHPYTACIKYFGSRGRVVFKCNTWEKKEDWTSNFEKSIVGEWLFCESGVNWREIRCSCQCSNLAKSDISGLMKNHGDICN